MVENVIIVDPERFEDVKKKFKEGGVESIHVVADFDRTLTKAFVDGQKSPTVIAQIRNGDYLGEDYVKKAHELFDYYHPIEIDSSISTEEKKEKMHEWWKKHFELLVESGLNKKVIKEIVDKKTLKFREGALEFFDLLKGKSIPLVIMTASPGDMTIEYIKQENKMSDNVFLIANLYEWDESGNATKVKEPIIHTYNKDETVFQGLPVYDKIKNKKNVILLGDSLGDVGMVEGFDYDNLIKIGFLNDNVEENLESFKENFDVIILNDGSMDFVNEFLEGMK